MRDYLRRTLSGQLPLFSLAAESAVGQLLGRGVPRLAESQVDSKKVCVCGGGGRWGRHLAGSRVKAAL
jgi:hypothetical protein